jgi:amino acid transporter
MVVLRPWSGGSVSLLHLLKAPQRTHRLLKWAVASFFILIVGMSMAELASAAPTSGGVCYDSRADFPLVDFCT